jgi:hypothetical protein
MYGRRQSIQEDDSNSEEAPTLVPVRCPICGQESVAIFPAIVVVVALTRWNNLGLHSSCHLASWNASKLELKNIRAHLGESWIDAHRPLMR